MAKRKPTSTNTQNREKLNNICGVTYAINILGGRWKLLILYKLDHKTLRFAEFKKKIPDISDRMLTLHLKELERDGLISREVYAEVPPRAEYKLTESGQALVPIWKQLEYWGLAHREIQEQAPVAAL
jgi:DNA-binding HxlR family transcriptional regulator